MHNNCNRYTLCHGKMEKICIYFVFKSRKGLTKDMTLEMGVNWN